MLRLEFNELMKSNKLRKPLQTYNPDSITNAEFDILRNEFSTRACLFTSLIRDVVIPPNKVDGTDEIDVDDDDDDDDDDEPLATVDSIDMLDSTPKPKRYEARNSDLILTSALNLLTYARSVRANAFQGIVGYYLLASNTSKRAIETLHRLGFSVRYESVIKALKANAESNQTELRKAVRITHFGLQLIIAIGIPKSEIEGSIINHKC